MMKKQLEKQVSARVKAYYEKGYAIKDIKKALAEKKYPPGVIRKLIREAGIAQPIPAWKIIGGVIIILAILGGVWGGLRGTQTIAANGEQCATVECLLEMANKCGKSVLVQDEQGLRVMYEVESCLLTKTVLEVPESEPQEVRDLLEGKSLQCRFEEGLFNEEWIDTLSLGLEECEGDLKEGILQIASAS